MSYRSELIQVAAVALAALQDLDKGTTFDKHNHFDVLVGEVQAERAKQEFKWGPQHHSPMKWMTILMEEVGEAAKDILEDNL